MNLLSSILIIAVSVVKHFRRVRRAIIPIGEYPGLAKTAAENYSPSSSGKSLAQNDNRWAVWLDCSPTHVAASAAAVQVNTFMNQYSQH